MTQALDKIVLPQKGSVLIMSPVFHFKRLSLYGPVRKKKKKLSHIAQDIYLNCIKF